MTASPGTRFARPPQSAAIARTLAQAPRAARRYGADYAGGRQEQAGAPVAEVRSHGAKPDILVFSADLAALATFEVLLPPSAVVHAASTQVATVSLLATTKPALAIVELGDDATAGLSVLQTVAARYARLPTIVITPKGFCPSQLALSGYQGLRIVLTTPYRFEEILDATAATGVLTPLLLGRPVLTALDFIRSQYARPLGGRQLARQINVSFSHLAHLFRRDLGVSIREYLTNIRLHVARHLLSESSCKLEYIAEITGFSDASHLSRIFTTVFGQRPGRYRAAQLWRLSGESDSPSLAPGDDRNLAGAAPERADGRIGADMTTGAASSHQREKSIREIPTPRSYQLVGIGFGPANIALAIALEELVGRSGLVGKAVFLEKQQRSLWHAGMLLPATTLQVSFLKDLVALRNPTSRYTFINFLRQAGRLDEFVNLRTPFPHRIDFSQYIEWAAEQFRELTRRGEAVARVVPVADDRGAIVRLNVVLESGACFLTKRIALATGGRPEVADVFHNVLGKRVFHSSEYLQKIPAAPEIAGKAVAVVGAGQSAAEILCHLAGQSARPVSILRSFAFRAADDSHFINEAFFPRNMDYAYRLDGRRREEFITSLRPTNYGVADRDLIESLYGLMYEARVRGEELIRLLPHTVVERARLVDDRVELTTRDLGSDERACLTFDYVILATGYRRLPLPECLELLRPHMLTDADGRPRVGRDFLLECDNAFQPAVYLLGFAEHTHGISDTLLSLAAHRAETVARSLVEDWESERHDVRMLSRSATST
jgi:L-ornithine N5-monooxygenase